MDFFKTKEPRPPPPLPQQLLQQAFSPLQNHFSSFCHNLQSNLPLKNPFDRITNENNNFNSKPCPISRKPFNFFKSKEPPATAPPQLLQEAVNSLQNHFSSFCHDLQTNNPLKNLLFARITNENNSFNSKLSPISNSSNIFTPKSSAMSAEVIEERLAGVPVFALTNGSQEFVLVSGTNTGKNLGLFCFSEADAEALLQHMKSVDPTMSPGSQVVPVALSKIFQIKVDGVALRLLPEACQIENALEERKRIGIPGESFRGVPVFQSKSLILRSQNKRYRPVFFRKEDLEKSLSRASQDQGQLNPILRRGDIQVAVFEDIIQGMKDGSQSSWDDVVFIPPGFDVSTDPSRQQ